MQRILALGLLLLCFLGFASQYIELVPYRAAGILRNQGGQPSADIGAPDERQHANYIQAIRTTGQLPTFVPGSPDLYETYQSHQPPLYYLLMSPIADPVSDSGGKTLRWVNALIGCGTLSLLFLFGCRFGKSISCGVCFAAVGLLPGFVSLHSAVSNDPLVVLLITASLFVMVDCMQGGWSWARVVGLGVLVGLALCTKTISLALLPTALVAWVISARQKRPGAKWLPIVAGVLAIAIASPLWIRNQQLYGDPFVLGAFKSAFGGTAQAKDFIEVFGAQGYWMNWVMWWTSRSFIGVFGYMDIFLPNQMYLLSFAVLFVLLCGWLLGARNKELPKGDGAGIVFGVFLMLILVQFALFNSTYFQAQARYLFPGIASFAMILGSGAFLLHKRVGPALILLLMISLNMIFVTRLPEEFKKRLVSASVTSFSPVSSNRVL